MLQNLTRAAKQIDPLIYEGQITRIEGLRIEATGPAAALVLGARAHLGASDGPVAEVVGFDRDVALLLACEAVEGLFPGTPLFFDPRPMMVYPGPAWLGRVVDAFGAPLDGLGLLPCSGAGRRLRGLPPPAHARARVDQPLSLGVSVLDIFAPMGAGQRMGLFAGSGVGKSTLMSMLTRHADADVFVIGLVGERGREVREFIEDALGPDGLARSVIVVATSDEPAPKRRAAAWTAMAIAEQFRDEGKSVFCLLDSVTRFALAQREIGLAAGEPPTTRGYVPSVFAELPKLLERAGPGRNGSGMITGLFTVLVDGDDHNEPVADAVRGILDGHVVLSRAIAERGRYPAVDVLKSLSRLATQLQGPAEAGLVKDARRLLALFDDVEELVRIGAYARGTDKDVDRAVALQPRIEALLSQSQTEAIAPQASMMGLAEILATEV